MRARPRWRGAWGAGLCAIALAGCPGSTQKAVKERQQELELVKALTQGEAPEQVKEQFRYQFVVHEKAFACPTVAQARTQSHCEGGHGFIRNEIVDTVGQPKNGVARVLYGTVHTGEEEGYVPQEHLAPLPDRKAFVKGVSQARAGFDEDFGDELTLDAINLALREKRTATHLRTVFKRDLLGFSFTRKGLYFAMLVPERAGSSNRIPVTFVLESEELLRSLQGQRYVCETEYCDEFFFAAVADTDEGGQPMFRILRFVDRFGLHLGKPPAPDDPSR